jgi:adenine deaminase
MKNARGSLTIAGMITDVLNRTVTAGTLHIQNGIIVHITPEPDTTYDQWIVPGFVDAHVHVESSMLVPSEFARLAVLHGTVATVSDPHEIANVLGVAGVRYMIDNGKRVPFKFNFGAPSCVPATQFETAGAVVTAADIRELFERDGLKYLSEMMNFPGVLFQDPMVMEKIRIAHELGKPVDGHAPGLRGEDARRYITAADSTASEFHTSGGVVISTDHECFTLEEALDKLAHGMKILIREGSAAKNFEALHSLISTHTQHVMLCSDDKHPNDLAVGHLDEVVRRALHKGHNVMNVLQCACVNPVKHYGLDVGLLQVGDAADFIVVNNLTEFRVHQTFINGECVAERGKTLIPRVQASEVNNCTAERKTPDDFRIAASFHTTHSDLPLTIRVIEALDGQLITNELHETALVRDGAVVADVQRDLLKLAVVNRYTPHAAPALAFIKNFGLQAGAIASSVGHDSHNIIAVGTSDEALCASVNALIDVKGGICVVQSDGTVTTLPLPVAGIMTTDDGFTVGEAYSRLDALAKSLGSRLHAPFMTLSFMALLVIPDLKLSDKGLFSGKRFAFTELNVNPT